MPRGSSRLRDVEEIHDIEKNTGMSRTRNRFTRVAVIGAGMDALLAGMNVSTPEVH
jgi:hypothetical protein